MPGADDLEAVAYSLRMYGCDALEPVIAAAVAELPEDAADFVREQCLFLSMPEGLDGSVWPARIATGLDGSDEDRWIIQLRSPLPEEAPEAVVAHEVAHAFLRHDKLEPDTGPDCEREAAELAARWGFTGYPTDPDHCTRPYS